MKRAAALALLFVALAAAPARAQDKAPPEVSEKSAAALEKARPDLEAADRALAAKDWDAWWQKNRATFKLPE